MATAASRLRFGLIGLHNHYHAYPIAEYLASESSPGRLTGVSDERPEVLTQFVKKYGIANTYATSESLIEAGGLDAVIITSATADHARHVELAADAGLPILLDKPIATTRDDADRIVAASQSVPIVMAHLLRFLPIYQRAKRLIDDGVLGDLVSGFYSIRIPVGFITDSPGADSPGWYIDPSRSGGGGFIDHAVHFADFFRWVFDEDPAEVQGRIGSLTYTELPVEDYGVATYRLNGGSIVTIESTWHAAEWYGPLSSPDRCTLTGRRGEMELHYQKSPQLEVASLDDPYRGRHYFDLQGVDRYEACYHRMVDHFVAVARGEEEPATDARDGRWALLMALGAYESNQSGRVVSLTEQSDG